MNGYFIYLYVKYISLRMYSTHPLMKNREIFDPFFSEKAKFIEPRSSCSHPIIPTLAPGSDLKISLHLGGGSHRAFRISLPCFF